jgi:hypothetical protein
VTSGETSRHLDWELETPLEIEEGLEMDTETKKLKRRENKKRKIAALLAVSELNDKDKSSKKAEN